MWLRKTEDNRLHTCILLRLFRFYFWSYVRKMKYYFFRMRRSQRGSELLLHELVKVLKPVYMIYSISYRGGIFCGGIVNDAADKIYPEELINYENVIIAFKECYRDIVEIGARPETYTRRLQK